MKDKRKASKLYIQKQEDVDGDNSQLAGISGYDTRKIKMGGGGGDGTIQSLEINPTGCGTKNCPLDCLKSGAGQG